MASRRSGPLGLGVLPRVRQHRKFIGKAVGKHKGSLRRFAARHRALTKDGRINIPKVRRAAERLAGKERTRRLRQISLARTLRRLRS